MRADVNKDDPLITQPVFVLFIKHAVQPFNKPPRRRNLTFLHSAFRFSPRRSSNPPSKMILFIFKTQNAYRKILESDDSTPAEYE